MESDDLTSRPPLWVLDALKNEFREVISKVHLKAALLAWEDVTPEYKSELLSSLTALTNSVTETLDKVERYLNERKVTVNPPQIPVDIELPEEIVHEPTVRLIMCAYPHGIPHSHYLTVLSILIEDMSIRVLSRVIAHIRGGHYTVYMGDVMTATNFNPDPGVAANIMQRLRECGYDEWVKAE